MSKPFRFKQFSLEQSQSGLKIGTDGVLLGAMASHPRPQSILDIGAGTGLVGLMLAQRYSEAQVDFLEVDEASFLECIDNCSNSPFYNRTKVYNDDWTLFTPNKAYDLIVSNPPFHLEDNSKPGVKNSHSLEPKSLVEKAIPMLKENGRLCVISSIPYFDQLRENMLENCDETIEIFPKEDKLPNRIISYWKKELVSPIKAQFILRNQDGSYTEDYRKFTKDFHPHF